MPSFTLTRRIDASPSTVFATITDHRGYPEFTPIRRVEIEREGERAVNGVGAVRALHLLGPPIREEVLDYEEPELFRYRLLSGAPVRSQIGTVRLTAEAGATRMDYSIEVEPLLPLGGLPTALGIRAGIALLLVGVKREAERRG